MKALITAKAPVPGRVKSRLAADVGVEVAAELAALALLDTIDACADAFGARHCHLAIDGPLSDATLGDRILRALAQWTVARQRGSTFGARLARAHAEVAGPRLQVGMDTPQLRPEHLVDAAHGLARSGAVLGPASDGGWWLLGVNHPSDAACLASVPMSTPDTGRDTRAALAAQGIDVALTRELKDVDTVADADDVARCARATRFARRWSEYRAPQGVRS